MENVIDRQSGNLRLEGRANGGTSADTSDEVTLSDTELWNRIVHYGEEARKWRQKFLGLLPEVARRELWRAHGFESVFVFAFKVAGVGKEQVERVLGIEERLRDKPILHEMLVRGEVSVNKLARVVSVATVDNQEALAGQMKLLPRQALETMVRDMKSYEKIIDSQRKPENMSNQFSFVHGHSSAGASVDGTSGGATSTLGKFTLTAEAAQKLQELYDKGIDISEFILTAAMKREQEIQKEKARMAAEMEKSPEQQQAQLPSRYIPQKIKNLLKQEYGTKCAISSCQKPSREIHHTARYGLQKQNAPYGTHNPHFLAPLCKQHHQIAHAIDVKYQQKRVENRAT